MSGPRSNLLSTHVLRPALLALGFMTALPLPQLQAVRDGEFARASGFYPLAGWAVGAVAALALWLPLPLPEGVRAALALSAWLAATGLLHFDGLLDCADAVFSMRSPERRREILKDVHVGAFGLATGGLALLLWWSLLGGLLPRPETALVAAVSARAALLLPMRLLPRLGVPLLGTAASSLGAASAAGGAGGASLWAPVLLTLPLLLLPGGWLGLLAALLTALLTALFCAGRLGGLNGDVFGACIVVSELGALLALSWGR